MPTESVDDVRNAIVTGSLVPYSCTTDNMSLFQLRQNLGFIIQISK